MISEAIEERQAIIADLKTAGGFTNDEIAAILGISRSAPNSTSSESPSNEHRRGIARLEQISRTARTSKECCKCN
ncbi:MULTISPECIES: hypothetical protein [unclassified Pseudarthrobacter]|uniref:hypothetical protein n=1 Tax=unclassified Pseudarthrobacter TaxID=2647000 RepID=UPI00307852F1